MITKTVRRNPLNWRLRLLRFLSKCLLRTTSGSFSWSYDWNRPLRSEEEIEKTKARRLGTFVEDATVAKTEIAIKELRREAEERMTKMTEEIVANRVCPPRFSIK